MQYQPIIGLEIHVQLKTNSKMFCSCDARYFGSKPNTHTCPVCLGLPGALPTINAEAVRQTIRVGLALSTTIAKESKFDRKNYFYPDLVKGYQISQYDKPLTTDGHLDIVIDGEIRRIGITRAHLEEDTAKSSHERDEETGKGYTLIDCNKSGVPLLEIVSEPDLRSKEEASEYAKKVREIVRYIGASDADMEKGQLRFDVNISLGVFEDGEKITRELPEKFTPIVEIKNLNSFRALEKSIEYEYERQKKEHQMTGVLYEEGNKETRGWDMVKEVTLHQRSKEEAQDYRYFPEPDLPPMTFNESEIEEIRATLPELPKARAKRFESTYGIRTEISEMLVSEKSTADWFENAARGLSNDLVVEMSKWVVGDITFALRELEMDIQDTSFSSAHLRELVEIIHAGDISNKIAKDHIMSIIESGLSPREYIEKNSLKQVSDTGALDAIIEEVFSENTDVVEDIKNGKESAIGFLMGQVMKKSKGQANPGVVQKLIRKKIME